MQSGGAVSGDEQQHSELLEQIGMLGAKKLSPRAPGFPHLPALCQRALQKYNRFLHNNLIAERVQAQLVEREMVLMRAKLAYEVGLRAIQVRLSRLVDPETDA